MKRAKLTLMVIAILLFVGPMVTILTGCKTP